MSNASSSEVVACLGDALKVRITSRPEKGQANLAVEAILIKRLGFFDGSMKIKSRQSSVLKWVEVEGLSISELHRVVES